MSATLCAKCKKHEVKSHTLTKLDGSDFLVTDTICPACRKEDDRNKKRQAREGVCKALQDAGVPFCGVGASEAEIVTLLQGWAAAFKSGRDGWFLYGAAGGYKTRALCFACETIALAGGPVATWINCPFMLVQYTAAAAGVEGSTAQILARMSGAKILVVDDWGKGVLTPRGLELIYAVVNRRYERRLPTLYTSNKPLEWLAKWVKADDCDYVGAIIRRIRETCKIVEVPA